MMTENKFDRTLQAVVGYICNSCPENISMFGKKFTVAQTVSAINCKKCSHQEITVRINEYKSYIKLQIRFMNKQRFPEVFTYLCTLNGLLSELIRAMPLTEPGSTSVNVPMQSIK